MNSYFTLHHVWQIFKDNITQEIAIIIIHVIKLYDLKYSQGCFYDILTAMWILPSSFFFWIKSKICWHFIKLYINFQSNHYIHEF